MEIRKKRHGIFDNPFVLIFLLIPLFKPASLEMIAPVADRVFDIWRIVTATITIAMYIMNRKLSKIVLVMILYNCVFLLSTVIHDGNVWKTFNSAGTTLSYCMLTELWIHKYSKMYFKSIFSIYLALTAVNYIVLQVFPEGISSGGYYGYSYNFLGIDNAFSMITIPSLTVACIYSAYSGTKLTGSALIMLLIVSATALQIWSATGIVVWFIEVIYILFIYRTRISKHVHLILLLLIFAVMQIFIVNLRMQNYFTYIIEDILGKSLTFTGRTTFWDMAYLQIAHSPFLGYGSAPGMGHLLYLGKYWYAHNGILELLLETGMIGLILYIALFVLAASKLYRYRTHFVSGIISIALFSFLVYSLMEASIEIPWLFSMLVIAYHVPEVIKQIEGQRTKAVHRKLWIKGSIRLIGER